MGYEQLPRDAVGAEGCSIAGNCAPVRFLGTPCAVSIALRHGTVCYELMNAASRRIAYCQRVPKRSFLVSASVAAAALAVLSACGSSSTTPAASSHSSQPSKVVLTGPSATPTSSPSASGACSYSPSGQAAKPAKAPNSTPITSITQATITTNRGAIGVTLNPKQTPCTVNSFVSLAQQGYFNNTPCHRLTTAGIYVLQCGDPTGTGSGGPGYQFNDELVAAAAPKGCSSNSCIYPAGTLAMANAGPDTNGSQFFLVYADSPLPYNYTIFGHMSGAGLAVVKQIAKHGSDNSNGQGDGKPNESVTIESVAAR